MLSSQIQDYDVWTSLAPSSLSSNQPLESGSTSNRSKKDFDNVLPANKKCIQLVKDAISYSCFILTESYIKQ